MHVPISDKQPRQQFNELATVDQRTSLPPIGRATLKSNLTTLEQEPNKTDNILYDSYTDNNDSIAGVASRKKQTK